MPDGSTRYYSNGGDITDSYGAQQKSIRKMLGESYHTLMDTLKQQIKGFDQDYSNHRDDIVQLEIQGMKSLHFLTCGNTPQMNTRIAAWAIPSANGLAGK